MQLIPHVQRQHFVITLSTSRHCASVKLLTTLAGSPSTSVRQTDNYPNILVYFSFLDKSVIKPNPGATLARLLRNSFSVALTTIDLGGYHNETQSIRLYLDRN